MFLFSCSAIAATNWMTPIDTFSCSFKFCISSLFMPTNSSKTSQLCIYEFSPIRLLWYWLTSHGNSSLGTDLMWKGAPAPLATGVCSCICGALYSCATPCLICTSTQANDSHTIILGNWCHMGTLFWPLIYLSVLSCAIVSALLLIFIPVSPSSITASTSSTSITLLVNLSGTIISIFSCSNRIEFVRSFIILTFSPSLVTHILGQIINFYNAS